MSQVATVNPAKPSKPPVEKMAYTTPEVATMLGISERSVFTIIASRELRSVKVGARSRRVLKADLDAYLNR